MVDKVTEKFFEEVQGLWDAGVIIKSAETEDEIGCVLRVHIYLERFLTFFLKEHLVGDVGVIIKNVNDFKPKLAFCTAFGMPTYIGMVLHQINGIRNKLAHGKLEALDKGDVQQLGRQVDAMLLAMGDNAPLSKLYIELPLIYPGERIQFGQKSLRVDFMMCSMMVLKQITHWLSTEVYQLRLSRVGIAKGAK